MFDARTLSQLERLFDLQMWAFGCDARHAGGNLFARRGMTRTPPPPGAATSSTWSDAVVSLSSTGVTVVRGAHALRLTRGALGPQLRGQPTALLRDFAAWVLAWEAWVDAEAGATWREVTLSSRQRPAAWSSAGLRRAWAALLDGPRGDCWVATRDQSGS